MRIISSPLSGNATCNCKEDACIYGKIKNSKELVETSSDGNAWVVKPHCIEETLKSNRTRYDDMMIIIKMGLSLYPSPK